MSVQLKKGSYENPQILLRKDALPGMAKRWEMHLDQLNKATPLDRLTKLTDEERVFKRKLIESKCRTDGMDETELSLIRDQRKQRAKEMARQLTTYGVGYQVPEPFADPPHKRNSTSSDGELWWAQTNWSWDDPGIVPFWDDSAGLRFSAVVDDPVDQFKRNNLTVVAQFDLDIDRIPPSLHGTVISTPHANVFGAVSGLTFANLLDFGDQWCKCWLNLTQIVWAHIPNNSLSNFFGPWYPLGINSSVIPLIFIESAVDYSSGYLPGPIQMPTVQFPLTGEWHIQVDLLFWFDIQLEGDNSRLTFGNDPLFQSNLIQTFQWNLTPA